MTARKRKVSDAARRSLSRLERILLLVPYCVRHPGVSIGELATRFDAPEPEIIEDLNLLFVCGLPDYSPADLIEVFIEEDRVYIQMADYFARPLRLTRTEAIPLYLKAQALVNLLEGSTQARSGLKELASLRSALEKLGKALLPQEGGVAELTKRIKVQLESGEAQWLGLLREAITSSRRVELEYYTYSRDALTRRQVDPGLVFASMGHWYFSGYCHLARDTRMFRLDRIKSLELTDEGFEAPAITGSELPPLLTYSPSPDDVRVKLRVTRGIAQWLGESGWLQGYLPVEARRGVRGGREELVLRAPGGDWLEKLLMRFGPEVEVLEPPELAERLKERAKAILALYAPKRKPKAKTRR
jgi:proteasome accessory factor C